ncbi:GNAT family N-acetyltransferase [Aliiglaciecola sp. 3_MG-2023]|uniref:GNAT family N-acetyltransferase n=1 Tax=Aliiglaciecola sp. 3_MG-2023 TaxID=3062644 RepID=UPI0026E45565|nr:GNAT family N-acetyltransferase [Aliiglaciecola sp. 3_MG-2023]MDO6691661.1 GNAT family N-acetyltransferase [Aliiglaciecola sp. 3_MG-2023]
MITIRQAEENDIQAIVDFNQAMAWETEQKKLQNEVLTAGVSALIGDRTKGFYLVAEQEDGVIVGSLMVTTEWSDWRNSQFWWIQSVYVRPENRRTGIYSGLYEKVKELADQTQGVCGFRLYVEHDNVIAQQTYQKLGMQPSHYYMYETDN